MRNDVETEAKRVRAKSKSERGKLRRDPTMTGGQRAETPEERAAQQKRKTRPKPAPIIERTP